MSASLKRHKNTKIFIDLDGTLLPSSGSLSTYTKAQIQRALDEQIEIWICSGRPLCFTQKVADNLDINIKKVSFNGCMIENNVKQWFETLILSKIIDTMKDSYKLLLKTRQTIYTNTFPIPESFRYCDENETYAMAELDLSALSDDQILKILILSGDDYQRMKQLLKPFSSQCEFSFYENLGVEITPKGIHKGYALREVRKEKDYLIGIGNDINDLPMFKEADLSVAVANSHPDVLNAAMMITESSEEDGVGKFIEKYLNLEGEI